MFERTGNQYLIRFYGHNLQSVTRKSGAGGGADFPYRINTLG